MLHCSIAKTHSFGYIACRILKKCQFKNTDNVLECIKNASLTWTRVATDKSNFGSKDDQHRGVCKQHDSADVSMLICGDDHLDMQDVACWHALSSMLICRVEHVDMSCGACWCAAVKTCGCIVSDLLCYDEYVDILSRASQRTVRTMLITPVVRSM